MKKFITIYTIHHELDIEKGFNINDVELDKAKLVRLYKIEEVNFDSYIHYTNKTKFYKVKLKNDDCEEYYIHEDDVKELARIEL